MSLIKNSITALALFPLIAFVGEQAAGESYDDDLFALSLEELLGLQIEGSAVRDIGLDLKVYSIPSEKVSYFKTASTIELMEQKTISARGLSNIVQVVESLGVLSGESPGEPHSFSMRGFSRDSIKALFDGMYVGSSTLNMRPLSTHNIQQVEVVKGPSNMLHGAGGAGGAVNFIWKSPKDKSFKNVSATVGKYDTASLGFEFNTPITNGAFHFDLYHRDSNGWVDNSPFNSTDMHVAIRYDIRDDYALNLRYSYLEDELPAYWGAPLVPRSVAQQPNTAVSRSDGYVLDESLRFVNFNVADNEISSEAHMYRIDGVWSVNESITNTSQTYFYLADRIWKNSESYIYNPDSGDVDRDRLFVEHERAVFGFINTTRYVGELGGKKHIFTAAVSHSDINFDREVGFNTTNFFVDSVDLRHPVAGTFGAVSNRPDKIRENISALTLTHWAEITEKLHYEGDVSFDYLDIKRKRFNFDESIRERLVDTFNEVTYRLGFTYNLTEKVMSYVQYSHHYDNYNADLAKYDDLSFFELSDVVNWEIGSKLSARDGDTQVSFAVFNIEKKSKQHWSGESNTITYVSNGYDFSVLNRVTKKLKTGLNLWYVDAEYRDYFDLSNNQDKSGNHEINVPDLMASVWTSYSNVFELPLEIGLGYQYVAERFADIDNTTELDSYTLLHTFAAYTTEQYRLMLHVNNLNDTYYVPWSDPNYPDQGIVGAPRHIELSLKAQF